MTRNQIVLGALCLTLGCSEKSGTGPDAATSQAGDGRSGGQGGSVSGGSGLGGSVAGASAGGVTAVGAGPVCDVATCKAGEACLDGACADLAAGHVWQGDAIRDAMYGTSPMIALSPAGFGGVAWSGSQGQSVRVSLFDPGSELWSTPVEVNVPGALSYGPPDIGVDDAGNAITVWHQGDNTARDAWAARYDAAARSWGAPTLLDAMGGGFSDQPRIAMDGKGNAVAVWPHNSGESTPVGNVQTNRYDAASGRWLGVSDIFSESPGGVDNVTIEMDQAGNALVAWVEGAGSSGVTRAARFERSTGMWSAPAVAGRSADGSTNHPDIGADGRGNFYVAWHQVNSGIVHVVANRYDAASGRWGTQQQLDDATTPDGATWPSLGGDDHGNALAIFLIEGRVAASRFDAVSQAWSRLPDAKPDGGVYDAWLGVDRGGNAIAVWRGPSDISVRRFSAISQTWSAAEPINLNTGGRTDGPVQLEIDDRGRALAAWYEIAAAGGWNIVTNRLE